LRRIVDSAPAVAVDHARIGRQHFHALGLEHHERRLVHRGDLIVGEHLQRLERIAQMPIGLRVRSKTA
jgi:hypothetical protein